MAGSFVTLFQWRLNSVLLQENDTLLGVKDQIMSVASKLNEVGSVVGDPFFRTLHALEMAKSFVELSKPKLKKSGKDQKVSLINKLDEVTRVAGDVEGIWACYQTWVRELRRMIHEAEDYIDDFIIKVCGQTGQDQKESILEFGSELENISSRVSEIMNRRPQLEASPILEEIQQFLRSRIVFYDDDEETVPASCMLNYINLPYDLKLCFLFFCALRGIYRRTKSEFVQVLVAAGLIQEKPGELMEDKAQENIEKLLDLGMLEEDEWRWDCLKVPSPYYKLSLAVMNAEDFFTSTANSDSTIPPTARHVSIHDADKRIPNMNSLLHSVFVSANKGLSEASSDCLETVLGNAKLVRVLDLENTQLKSLPDGVGNLVNLRYLGVRYSKITELPESISNLRNLQTLDISWSGYEFELSKGVLNLVQLRHLKMFRPMDDGEVRVPQGISRLRNLQTLEGIYAGSGIAKELGNMTQLRSLEVLCVADDHADELYASVMRLTGLRNLSLTVERIKYTRRNFLLYEDSLFPCLESFSPPPLLQTLELTGKLIEMPIWLGSMENLTKLYMCYSLLSENPTTILQFLPNLKYLLMEQAYKWKRMEREFFRAGGFPKLEYLKIISDDLVEWTEMEEGALPCLKQLRFCNCMRLMGLPEGLQHLATLQKLVLFNVHGDLTRRLDPNGGPQNYKIKHIPRVESYVGLYGWRVWKS